jgi:hypothetical protein
VAIASENKTIVGVFNSVSEAQGAVRDLEAEGISRSDISVVANKSAAGYDTLDKTDKASDVVADAGIGAAIGGVGGLLLSAAGAITVPVIGPILAAGPIAAALTGAGIGAAAGGLVGALTESGVPEEHAKYYAEGVRRGDVLVTVKAGAGQADRVCDILDRHQAVDVDDRVSNWKQRGWAGYSETATPLREDELREERRYYSDFPSEYRSDMPHHSTSGVGESVREMGRDVGEGFRDAGEKVKDWGHRVAEEGRELRDEARDKARRMENDRREEEYRRRSRIYDHLKY